MTQEFSSISESFELPRLQGTVNTLKSQWSTTGMLKRFSLRTSLQKTNMPFQRIFTFFTDIESKLTTLSLIYFYILHNFYLSNMKFLMLRLTALLIQILPPLPVQIFRLTPSFKKKLLVTDDAVFEYDDETSVFVFFCFFFFVF